MTLKHKHEYKISELEHYNSSLVLQNTLIVEKFCSILKSFENIQDFKLLQEKSNEKVKDIFHFLISTSKFYNNLEKDLKSTLNLNKNLLQDLDLAQNLKSYLSHNKKTLIKPYKAEIKDLKLKLSYLSLKNQEYEERINELESKLSNFIQELEKQRRKSKLSIFFGDKNEQTCGKCQKVFSPILNFNWSCRYHKARIINDLWFCCGKTGSDAIGCLLDKHISVEELEIIEEHSKQIKLFCYVRVMKNCKSDDHLTDECYFDPNIRAKFEPYEELERLERNKEKKIMKNTKVQKFDEKVFDKYDKRDF